jgi:hypothetical protein
MGVLRNGARTFLFGMQKACKLSRMPGFQIGLVEIMGGDRTTQLMTLWEPLCALVDFWIATDNWYNQRDQVDDDTAGGEDEPLGV